MPQRTFDSLCTSLCTGILLCAGLGTAARAQTPSVQTAAPATGPLTRHYTAGNVLRYVMTGDNQGWRYTVQATDTVKRDATGSFYEEIGWYGLESNAPMTLSAASLALRQTVSLDNPRKYMTIPDMSHVQPALIGPITDMLTFYSDLVRAHQYKLGPANPHVYVQHSTPNSWADGQHFLIAQDAVDFDLTLDSDDAQSHTAMLTVRHVPPAHPEITLPAAWMQTPVADTANNWVQVSRNDKGYLAEVGKETFEVHLRLNTRDGKILSVHMDNPVTCIARQCTDAALTGCAPATPEIIHRVVSLDLLP